jgi:hypothetical protein
VGRWLLEISEFILLFIISEGNFCVYCLIFCFYFWLFIKISQRSRIYNLKLTLNIYLWLLNLLYCLKLGDLGSFFLKFKIFWLFSFLFCSRLGSNKLKLIWLFTNLCILKCCHNWLWIGKIINCKSDWVRLICFVWLKLTE